VCCYGSPTIANTIIAFNSSGYYQGEYSSITLSHNCVYGNGEYNYSGDITDPTPSDGNISEDPGFASVEYRNWHIQPDSPCVNAGSNSYVHGAYDIDGQARIQPTNSGTVDIGADESDGTVWPPPPIGPNVIVRVTPQGSDLNDGSEWVNHAMLTIQAAIEKADLAGGGEVWVKTGTYYERITLYAFSHLYGGFFGNETQRDDRDWNAYTTIIDGDHGGSVVTANGWGCVMGSSVIDGFTIRNGSASNGGGIRCNYSFPTIANNTITENGASDGGGGIYCNYSSPTITNNTITENNATDGFGGGILSKQGSPAILGNVISYNSATDSYSGEGGGIHCEESSATITANTFDSNTAGNHGGGIAMHDSMEVSIINNLFVGNSCTGVDGLGGGAIHARDSGPVIANNTFVENRVGTGTWPNNFTPWAYGGAIHVRGTPQTKITNNVFYGNKAQYGNSVGLTDEGVAVINYCDAYPDNGALYHYYDLGNPPSHLPPGLDTGTCMYEDPLFYLTGEHPYWLQSDPASPLRGAGLDPAQGNGVPTTDKDGRPRPGENDTTDIGPYEDNP